jgi:hypothetical protein
MSWNGHTVIDMDAHIRERADKFFKDYIDPEYREPFKSWTFDSHSWIEARVCSMISNWTGRPVFF